MILEHGYLSFIVVVAFIIVGACLESIGGKHGFLDELLTPFPFGLAGLGFVLFERYTA